MSMNESKGSSCHSCCLGVTCRLLNKVEMAFLASSSFLRSSYSYHRISYRLVNGVQAMGAKLSIIIGYSSGNELVIDL